MVTFVHGWGCDKSIWGPFNGQFFDRGYFKEPAPFVPSKKLVAHSFGLHLVPTFEQVEELVILSSFITFVPKKRIVEQMLKRFSTDPQSVLRDFLGFSPPNDIDKNLLEVDLKHLSVNIFNTGVIKNVPTIHIVHGRSDPITPFEWGYKLHQELPQSRFYPFDGGHFDSIQEAHRLGLF